MRIWKPDLEEPHLLDWWLPLVRAGRRALIADLPWLVLIDEWALVGRVLRRPRPDVWIYVHHESRRELFLDDTGQTYRFIPNTTGPSPGRFKELRLRPALWQAGLPDVAIWCSDRRPAPLDMHIEEGPWMTEDSAAPVDGPRLRLVH